MNKVKNKGKSLEELLEEALVPVEEQPYEVPENWVWTKMGIVGDYINGKAFKSTEWADQGRPIIRIQNLTNSNDKAPNFFDGEIDSKYVIRPGDFLISWSGTLGAYLWNGPEGVLNQHIFKVKSKINKHYHFYLTNTLINQMYSKTHGSGMVHVTKKVFDELAVPLPPIDEQKRIANKIESLFAKIDEAKQLIDEAKESFELRRAAILDKAFRGELTLSNLIELDVTRKNELPKEWKWENFADVATVKSNLKNPLEFPEMPHIAPDNITKGTGKLLDYKSVKDSDVKSPKHLFKKGQILYSKIRPYLSKLVIAEFDGLCSADMYPIETELEPEYLYWLMLSPYFVEKASTAGSRSVLPKINQKELGNILIPVPPIEEQQKIVNLIRSYLTVSESSEELINEAEQLEAIKQSILQKAFLGELGTNNPTEESAIELLKENLKKQLN